MMPAKSVENLGSPPEVGETCSVPCLYGVPFNIGHHKIPPQWWPVFRPSHEDSKYLPLYRTVWEEEDGKWDDHVEIYFESCPSTPHHWHVDPRFSHESLYTPYERQNADWHTIVSTIKDGPQDVEYRDMICIRGMPTQRLFTGFGKRFVDDHRGKKLKCLRCPHKGVSLESVPVEDGVITCPAHGLRYDAKSQICISEWPPDKPPLPEVFS